MNAIVEMNRAGIVPAGSGRMSASEVVQHAMTVQEVMRAVMKDKVHFGTIPGTDKPTLYQPGADVLCMTFRIAAKFEVEDLSTSDAIRYRVVCRGIHQMTGVELGSGIGEGSTSEEKYRWRRAVCKEEFEATPAGMRRVKYARGKGGSHYTQEQVRTEPADVANTVLKMAAKRAKIAMVLNVTAASDMFGQDLEDLDDALRESIAGSDPGQGTAPPPPPTWPDDAFAAQFPRWKKAIEGALKTADDIIALARSKGALTAAQESLIRGVKVAEAEAAAAPAPPPIDDDFVRQMGAAEGGAQ